MPNQWKSIGLWVGCIAALGSPVNAGGGLVPGAGPPAQARAGAQAARADDPSALAYNPAGFAKLDGTQVYIGLNFLNYALSFQRAGNYEPVNGGGEAPTYEGLRYPKVSNRGQAALGPFGFQLVPVLAMSSDLGYPQSPFRFGFGVFSPQGYPNRDFTVEVQADVENEVPAPQRYDVVKQKISVVSPSVVVAYSPSALWDVGIRVSWGLARISGTRTVWGERNYEEDPRDDANFTISESSDDFVPSVGIGALYRLTPQWEIGAAWNSATAIGTRGSGRLRVGGAGTSDDIEVIPRPDFEAECATGGARDRLATCVDTDIAQSATIAARWILRRSDGSERGDVELDVKWEDWSAASASQIQVDGVIAPVNARLRPLINDHGFKDVISTRLGGGYRIKMANREIEFKAGVAYDTETASDTWTRVDQDNKRRVTLSTGASYETGRYRFDLGVGVILEPDVRVDDDCPGPNGFGPEVTEPGCQGVSEVADRNRPSPGQPLFGEKSQLESPFNAGLYKSRYVMFSTGVRIVL